MKITLFFIFFVTFSFSQSYDWTITGGDVGWDEVSYTDVDDAGNIYTIGTFEGTVDFDPGSFTLNMSSQGGWDAFIAKYDPSGNLLWAHRFGGADLDIGKFVKCEANGDVYITGSYTGTVDFDPSMNNESLTTSTASPEAFVAKFDASGALIWAKGIAGEAEIFALDTDADGNLYGTGSFRNTVDFDPSTNTFDIPSNNTNNIFAFKWSSSADFIWAHGFLSNAYDRGNFIHVDDNNDLYLTGYFEETVDFDPGSGTSNQTANSGKDVFVLKLDASGGFYWVKTFGGTGFDAGKSIITNGSGAYLTGYFLATVDFNSGAGTAEVTAFGETDIFVLHLNHSGDFQWVNNYGGLYEDYGNAIALDNSNNVYFSGSFSGSSEFDPGAGNMVLNSEGGQDIFVCKINEQGVTDWTIQMGGTGDERANTVVISDAFSIYSAGMFYESTDFDPSSGTDEYTAVGERDFFLHKYSYPLSLDQEESPSELLLYPNPVENGIIYINESASKLYDTYEIRNSQGKILSRSSLDTSHSTVNLDKHTSGIYYITLINQNERVTKKVIVGGK